MGEALRNWAGNVSYAASAVHAPRTVAELRQIVRQAGKARVVGSRHSFSRIADTDGALISLARLNGVTGIDPKARTVTVEGGITYGQLCPILESRGLALPNLASLPHISVVGACSTATHGSGNANRNLAAALAGLTSVTAEGETVTLSRGEPAFDGAVVGLGALGVVVEAVLDVVPSFEVRQELYEDLPFAALVENFTALSASAYSVSVFTRWRGDGVDRVWLKSRADAPPRSGDLFGARAAERAWHPIVEIDPAPATEQLGVAGPWYERLPHFRLAFQPSVGAELQSEYFVARADAAAALVALHGVRERIAPQLLVSEIRTIAADPFWMSPCYGQDCVAFHFTWKPDWPAVRTVLSVVEAALMPFGVRPHWGKVFTMAPAEVKARFPRLDDFRSLCGRLDPEGKFRNAFLDTYVF